MNTSSKYNRVAAVVAALCGVWMAPTATATTPPPSSEKPVFGTVAGPLETSDNFAITWIEGEATSNEVQPLLDDLEAAWAVLIEQDGWPGPPSSEAYRLWVVLDASLADSGQTRMEGSVDAVPVIRVHPDALTDTTVRQATAAHEFHHAIQLGLRDDTGTDDAWFSDASATWAEGRVWPMNPQRFDASRGYLDQPDLRYDALDGGHAAGMWGLLDALEPSGEAVLAIWDRGRDGSDWVSVMEAETGRSAAEVWAGFTSAVLAGSYGEPVVQGTLSDNASATLPLLGTHYWLNDTDEAVGVQAFGYSGGAVVAVNAMGQTSGDLRVEPGQSVAVTALLDGSVYWLDVTDAPPSVGERPGSEGDGAAPFADPSTQSSSAGCAALPSNMANAWLWCGVLLTIVCLNLRREVAD